MRRFNRRLKIRGWTQGSKCKDEHVIKLIDLSPDRIEEILIDVQVNESLWDAVADRLKECRRVEFRITQWKSFEGWWSRINISSLKWRQFICHCELYRNPEFMAQVIEDLAKCSSLESIQFTRLGNSLEPYLEGPQTLLPKITSFGEIRGFKCVQLQEVYNNFPNLTSLAINSLDGKDGQLRLIGLIQTCKLQR